LPEACLASDNDFAVFPIFANCPKVYHACNLAQALLYSCVQKTKLSFRIAGARPMKRLLILLLLGGALVAGIAYWVSRPRTAAVSQDLFTYAPVEFGTLIDAVSATGVLKPQDVLVVTSELPGTVVDVRAGVNDTVSEGEVVVKLDDSRVRLKVELAAAAIEAARTYVDQAQSLEEAARLALKYQQEIAKEGGFRSEKDQAEAKLRAAQASVKVAKAKVHEAQTAKKEADLALEQTQVRVPTLPTNTTSSGSKRRYVVLDRKVQLGQMVGPTLAQPLFTLAADLRDMEVHAQVAEGDVGKVRKGLPATFTVSAYAEGDVTFRGKVRQVQATPTSVQGVVFYDTIIDVTNQRDPQSGEWQLRPGMTAAVDIIRREHRKVWKLPTAALSFQLDPAYQSDVAQARLAQWNTRPDHADWRAVWVWDGERQQPWPIFVRIGGMSAGETGIADGQYNEILAWEPGREPNPAGPPLQVIINAPPPHRAGLFDQPTNIKF
jgi:HlyD family secretion protein